MNCAMKLTNENDGNLTNENDGNLTNENEGDLTNENERRKGKLANVNEKPARIAEADQ